MGHSASQQNLFSLLPETRTPWTEFVFSTGTQVCLVAFLVWVRLLHPEVISAPEHIFRSIQLITTTPVPVNHQPQPSRQLPKPVLVADLDVPTNALRLPTPQPRVVKVEEASAPTVSIAAKKLDLISPHPMPVPKVVATNVFSAGSSAAPTLARTPSQVQTGGFGDPNGIPARANQAKAVNIAAAGSFDLPSGTGYGNGNWSSKSSRGVSVSSGFGNGTPAQDSRLHNSISQSAVQQSGFGDADAPVAAGMQSHPAQSAAAVPAEILSKPAPLYTQEARGLKIEGEVLLEVVLESSGSLRVLRVLRGLGHGLDDNAVKAAEQIRFKPATRNGEPADSTVVLHIIFQLA